MTGNFENRLNKFTGCSQEEYTSLLQSFVVEMSSHEHPVNIYALLKVQLVHHPILLLGFSSLFNDRKCNS